MLNVQNINVSYGPVEALRGVSLSVDEGEIVALLGANGAGKTTTLRAISGLLSPTAGSIRIRGQEAAGLPAQRVVRLGVAHMPEGRELFPEMTVTENLRLGHWALRQDSKGFPVRLRRAFDLFPRLEERASQAAGTLSGGEQQMLVFARALMSEPKLLLVDELSLGLAPMLVSQLFDAIDAVNAQGTSVLLVEQFVHLALKHSARAYILAKGEVVIEGPSDELMESSDVMSAYLGDSVSPEQTASTNGHGSKTKSRKALHESKQVAVQARRRPEAGAESGGNQS